MDSDGDIEVGDFIPYVGAENTVVSQILFRSIWKILKIILHPEVIKIHIYKLFFVRYDPCVVIN